MVAAEAPALDARERRVLRAPGRAARRGRGRPARRGLARAARGRARLPSCRRRTAPSAVWRGGDRWAVAGRRVEVAELPDAHGRDGSTLTVADGGASLLVDGLPSFGRRSASVRRGALGAWPRRSGTFVVRRGNGWAGRTWVAPKAIRRRAAGLSRALQAAPCGRREAVPCVHGAELRRAREGPARRRRPPAQAPRGAGRVHHLSRARLREALRRRAPRQDRRFRQRSRTASRSRSMLFEAFAAVREALKREMGVASSTSS